MSFHFIVRLEPQAGKSGAFREELLRVVEPTRAEPGCLRIDIFESVREPLHFAIHFQWVNEAAFDLHTRLPHTIRFVAAAEGLLTNSIEGLRLREI